MRFLHIISAVIWLIAMAVLFINWSFDEPLSPPGKFIIAYAIAHTTYVIGIRALECIDELTIIYDQRMDRRPRL
jgi:hypothetical protein